MTSQPASNERILERLEVTREDVREIKTGVQELVAQVNTWQLQAVEERTRLKESNSAAWRRIDEHEKRLKAIEDTLHPLIQQSKILSIVGTSVTLAIIGLIVSIMTHQVTILVP